MRNKTIQFALVALAAIGFAASATAATQSVGSSQDYQSIQPAVDAASTGDTVEVYPGTYVEDVTVNKEITVTGMTSTTGNNPAVVDGRIKVTAAGATVSDIKVAPKTTYTSDNWNKAGSPFGILATASDVTVKDNVVDDLTVSTEDGYISTNAIQVFHGGPNAVTNVEVEGNTVTGLENQGDSDWPYGGAAGIKVQGVVEEVDVTRNTVESVHSSGWTYGIVTTDSGNAPGVSPEDVSVEENTVEEVNEGSIYDVSDNPAAAPYPGVGLGIDGESDADEVEAHRNNFVNMPFGVHNKDSEHTLDATQNYWGHASGPSARTNPAGKQVGQGVGILGDADWSSYLVKPFGQTPNHRSAPAKRGP